MTREHIFNLAKNHPGNLQEFNLQENEMKRKDREYLQITDFTEFK